MSEEFLALVRKGQAQEFVVHLKSLTPSERRNLAGPVKQLAKTDGGIQQIAENGWRTPDEIMRRWLVVAGAGCLPSAAEVAAWLERYAVRLEHVGWIVEDPRR